MTAQETIEYLQSKIAKGDMQPDEPLFVLRGVDWLAPQLVYHWAMMAHMIGVPAAKINDAHLHADIMQKYPIKRVPGVPGSVTMKKNPTPSDRVASFAAAVNNPPPKPKATKKKAVKKKATRKK